uniref:Proton-coupled folate transporter n=1 Tax=Cacopsylla melanoneura TaxID=428564 RepID=A0A8D8RNZ8_9HEMI
MEYYVIEQLFFVVFFGRAIAQFTTSNLILHKLCVGDDVNHYLGKICPNEQEAQEKTTILNTYLFVASNFCYVIVCIVGGVWSDLNKRIKPLLWIPVLGLLICEVVNIAFVYFWSVPGIVVALFNGFMCMFGEMNLFYTGGLAYVTEHSPESLRTFRIGLLIGAFYISTPIGQGLAGIMNVKYGFINCYLVCIGLYIPCLIIITCFLPEKEDRKNSKYGNYYAIEEDLNESHIEHAGPTDPRTDLTEEDRIVNINNNVQTDDLASKIQLSEHLKTEDSSVISVNEAAHIEDLNKLNEINITQIKEEEINSILELKDESRLQNANQTNTKHEVAFENKAFEEEWKDISNEKNNRLKNKDPLNNFAKGPPLQDKVDETYKEQRSLLMMTILSIQDSWKTLVRPRTEHRTAILVVMVFASPFYVAPVRVESSVFPLFVRTKFQWTEATYGVFTAFKLSVIVVGICFSIGFLSKVLKVPDSLIGTVASCSDTLACFGYMLVRESWQMYLVPFLDIFHGAAQVCSTAIISKMMDESERAKIFAFKIALNSLFTVILYPLYNFVYKNTLTYFPAAFFLISAACCVPGILAFSYVRYLQHKELNTTITTKM